jgi:hypothetical protein
MNKTLYNCPLSRCFPLGRIARLDFSRLFEGCRLSRYLPVLLPKLRCTVLVLRIQTTLTVVLIRQMLKGDFLFLFFMYVIQHSFI